MMRAISRLLSLVVTLSVCWSVLAEEPKMTNPLLSSPRPWCIGRFVFDRPAASEISNQRYKYRGDQLQTFYGKSVLDYKSMVRASGSQLRKKKRTDPGDGNREINQAWLEKEIHPTEYSSVFIFQDAFTEGVKLPFESEGYIYDKDTIFHTRGRIGSSAIGKAEEIYNDTYRRIKSRDNWTVPTESGFCFDGGIVTGSSIYTEELSQSFALMPGRAALLVIQMRDAVDEDRRQSLTATLPELRAQMDRLPGHYRILREGRRRVADMEAEEVLFELKDGDVTGYRFFLLAPGDSATLAKPHTSIQLLLGAPARSDFPAAQATSPVDEAGALDVWDTLLNSLRLRPGAV